MNARSIRYFVWSKNKQLLLKDGQAKPSRKQQPPTVSKADWDAFIEGHKDPAGLLLFTTATPGGVGKWPSGKVFVIMRLTLFCIPRWLVHLPVPTGVG